MKVLESELVNFLGNNSSGLEGKFEATATKALTPYQVKRYSRRIIMPQVGSNGQRKLLAAKVMVIGAGGLGSPAAI